MGNVRVCMYIYGMVQDSSGPCTATPQHLLCSSSGSSLCQSHTSDEAIDFPYGGLMVVSRFHEVMTQVRKLGKLLPHSHTVCVILSSLGASHKWDPLLVPVPRESSSATHRSWWEMERLTGKYWKAPADGKALITATCGLRILQRLHS
jgi:hypothetical protein